MRRALPLLALAALLLVPTASAEPVQVGAGVYVLSLGNYDVNKGTYTLDLYLVLSWDPATAPANFTPEKFEFMNGRAAAKEKLFDEVNATTGERELWYRVQANLYSAPQFDDFPFDRQSVRIEFEDSIYTTEDLVYVPREDVSALDEGFHAAGWRTGEHALQVVEKDYAFGETYSRVQMSVELSRERFSTAIKSLLPPIAFILVAALQFFIHPSKWNNRLGLGTGMLISSVMFHISQTVALPPIGRLILFDKVMIAVYLFVVGSLAVTTLIAIDEDWWKDRDHTRAINLYGAAATILVSGATLILLLRFA